MKTAVIFALIFSLSIGVYAQHRTKVISILTIGMGGNYSYFNQVGVSRHAMNEVTNKDYIYKTTIDKKHFLLKQQTINYISKYVFCHCDSTNKVNGATIFYVKIEVLTETGTQKCYLIGREQANNYFIGLKKWIDKSPYKKECQNFLRRFEPFIREAN